jgi:hypothetical protein
VLSSAPERRDQCLRVKPAHDLATDVEHRHSV